FQAEDGIRDGHVTGVQTCALPISIRQYAEDWTLDRIVQSTVDGVTYAVKHGLPVMYVTEDTTRAKPEALKALYGAAIDCGATRKIGRASCRERVEIKVDGVSAEQK